MPCPYCGYPINPGTANHPGCVAKRITQLEDALRSLRMTARVLLQNSEGCAVNHYGEDYYLHVEPGWLKDCRKSIEAAESELRNSPEGVPTSS
jgi:hypothetical protein